MIDKQGKISGRVSVIDIILVLVVLALIAGFAYRRATPHIGAILQGDAPFYVTFEVNRIRGAIAADAVVIGDQVFRQHATQQPIGTIVAIERYPATEVMMRTDGTALVATMEDRYSLRITVRSTGSITPAGYFANGNDHLAPGGEVALINSQFIFPLARVYAVGEDRY